MEESKPMNKETEQMEVTSLEKIYDFLVKFIMENIYAPLVREICEGTGLNSTSTVNQHLLTLEMLGKIRIEKGKPRAIKLIGFKCIRVR